MKRQQVPSPRHLTGGEVLTTANDSADDPAPTAKADPTLLLREYVNRRANQIVDGYLVRLTHEGNGLLVLGPDTLRRSATHMLNPVITGDPGTDRLMEDVAHARADASVSPYESLRAAGCLYDLAAEVVTDGATVLDSPPRVIAAVFTDLHEAVFARIRGAALPYAHQLLAQISSSHLDERRRMARDLHDQAGQSLALAMLQAELHAEDLKHADLGATDGSVAILETLRDASQALHDVAQEIGRSSFVTHLPAALLDWIGRHGDTRVQLNVDGRAAILAVPAWMQDELYLAIREGVRNALAHTDDDAIRVDIHAVDDYFSGSITDKGPGMTDECLSDTYSSGKGLGAMRDRIRLLCGSLTVTSSRTTGTKIDINVPLVS